ncbi:hypothetical protein [Pontibacter akesuensis]|uniref:Uncharacterized protein n=1 Tax=Pontibacter akesuensis TaxID=388950 RepID=A0A1I7K4X0_9BACT|nr:hypothetical protein [Pontibacter akesuensis]GHA75029.1 hypothetical protein GCM10007389_31060 [Pontibacter akesuensis]SFU92487.1 hypothetical protein SAMN04487941_3400 [Pontibacter akesuensis]
MNLNQFNRQPLEQRTDLILRHGTYLAVRYRSQYVIRLYHFNSFFAEVWFEPRRDRFVLARSLCNHTGLHPYLDQVNISDILQQ